MGNGVSKTEEFSDGTHNHSNHYSHRRFKSKRNQKLNLEKYWIHATDTRLAACSNQINCTI